MPDPLRVQQGLIFLQVIILIGLGLVLLRQRSRQVSQSLLPGEDDPRQLSTDILLIVIIIMGIIGVIASRIQGYEIYIYWDAGFIIVNIGLWRLNRKQPRLARYLLVIVIVATLRTFSLGSLFSPSGRILLAFPVVIAGLLFETWEMLLFMAILIGIYTLVGAQFPVSPSVDYDFDLFAQLAFISLGIIAMVTSSTLTRAFYRERALRKAQEQMLRTVCHEMRTPVAALRSFWAATHMEGLNVSLGSLEPLAAGAEQHTEYLHQLTERVVQLVRGRQVQQPKAWVDLADAARRSLGQLELRAQAAGITLTLHGANEPLPARGSDEWQIVFVNLIENAIHHSRGTRIEVVLARENSAPQVSVCDDGQGLPPDLQVLAQPWVHHDQPSTNGLSQGMGLGWTIIRDICQRNQAHIAIGPGIGGQGLGVTITFAAQEGPARWQKRLLDTLRHKMAL